MALSTIWNLVIYIQILARFTCREGLKKRTADRDHCSLIGAIVYKSKYLDSEDSSCLLRSVLTSTLQGQTGSRLLNHPWLLIPSGPGPDCSPQASTMLIRQPCLWAKGLFLTGAAEIFRAESCFQPRLHQTRTLSYMHLQAWEHKWFAQLVWMINVRITVRDHNLTVHEHEHQVWCETVL